ncbi:Zona pellucida-like domain [Popillia japonica]|uniref:Zona pellucida-like domain n=1 Tax=Popillia japonica TaxID=7064 RepID=A0AAW1IWL2_POPJA
MDFERMIFAFVNVFLLYSIDLIQGLNKETVHINSNNEISYISAPLTKMPLSSWIEVQKGIYPKISPINDEINIGESITLLIYFNDPSRKYDVSVSDCWAYDDEDYQKARNRLNLVNDAKGTKDWFKLNYPTESNLTSVLYSTFTSFKFPESDKDVVYLTCNIKVCFFRCGKEKDT